MAEQKPSRGLTGTLVKLWRGGDFELTVTSRTAISAHYLRLHFDAGGLLAERTIHPTMWVRGWFPEGDKSHQRGYTLVNPDPAAGTVDIDFALRDGLATRWAKGAAPGDKLEVTVLGSNFQLPTPAPAGYVIVGDTASLPAINSLLEAIGETPAKVFLEAGHDDDRELPVRGGADVIWVDRTTAGAALVDAVSSSAFPAADHFGWVACDNRTTRSVAKVFREDFAIPRKSIKAQAYWAACRFANATVIPTDNRGAMTLISIRTLRFGAAALAVIAPWLAAGPAQADTYAQLDEIPVLVSPTCAGTSSSEAVVAPFQEGDRVEDGVRVAVHFSSPNHDGSCALTVTAAWHNLDTGASGGEDIAVVSTDPAGNHYGFAGYNRAHFWAGRGTVVVTVSTHPDNEIQVDV